MSAKEWEIGTIIVASSAIVLSAVFAILKPLPVRAARASDFVASNDPAIGNPSIYNRQTENNPPESNRASSVYESLRGSDSFHSASSRGGKRKTKRKSSKR